MKKISRQDAIYRLALAGIAAALATVFVTLGVYIRFTTVAFYIAAGLALMLPLSQKYYSSTIAAYVVAAIASFFIAGNISTAAGFIFYFGPMSILTGVFVNLHVKQYIAVPIKAVVINGVLALLFFVFNTIVVDQAVMDVLPYWAIAIIGTILLLAIDFALQFLYVRLAPIVGKVIRKKESPSEETTLNDDESPFEEDLYTDIYQKDDEFADDKLKLDGEKDLEDSTSQNDDDVAVANAELQNTDESGADDDLQGESSTPDSNAPDMGNESVADDVENGESAAKGDTSCQNDVGNNANGGNEGGEQ